MKKTLTMAIAATTLMIGGIANADHIRGHESGPTVSVTVTMGQSGKHAPNAHAASSQGTKTVTTEVSGQGAATSITVDQPGASK